MNEILKAKKMLGEIATDWVIEQAKALEDTGRGEWVLDPEVPGVVGLLHPGTNNAWLIVYLEDQDFESSGEFDELD